MLVVKLVVQQPQTPKVSQASPTHQIADVPQVVALPDSLDCPVSIEYLLELLENSEPCCSPMQSSSQSLATIVEFDVASVGSTTW